MLFAPTLSGQDAPPRNIQIDVLIERAGYESGPLGRTSSSGKTQQFLITLEGHAATLFVGKRVPQLKLFRRYLTEHEYIDYSVELVEVGTRLRLLPRVEGGRIVIEVTPEVSFETLARNGEKVVELRELSTTVSAGQGERIQLGTFGSQSEILEHFYRTERGEQLVIFLTPTVLESF